MKTSRVSRMIQILTALQSGQRYTVDDLAKMLDVSRRTVFRDLKDLRKAGVPCSYEKKDRYYTVDPEFFLPAPELDTQEALWLLLLTYKARDHIYLPFRDSATQAALKIQSNLPSKTKQYCSTALLNISIKAGPQARTNLLHTIFAQLLEAILKKRIVTIRYYLPRQQKSIVTNLSPYHLMYIDHTWCVIGKSTFHKEVRTFKFNQIRELEISDKCFIEDYKFDIDEYLGRSWSMRPEGRLYNVKLKFLPEIAYDVAQVQWHSTQMVAFENDGSAIVEFRVDGLSEITWWILSYGDRVKVLKPEILRQKIIEIAKNVAKPSEQSLPAK